MSYSTGNRGGGRRSYGERSAATSRPPQDDKAVWLEHANALGVSLGSWLIIVANKETGLELPDFVEEELDKAEALKNHPKLEELPMQRAS